jgi:hypothetical protein
MHSPEVVVGYLVIVDLGQDAYSPKHQATWCDLLESRLQGLSGRKAPHWSVGTIEGSCVVRADFTSECALVTGEAALDAFFDELCAEVKARNPSLLADDG